MFLENNDIITEHQSSFRKQYSCETEIQTVIDAWKLIVNEKKMIGIMFMDSKQAIDRKRLLEKLYQCGILEEWFLDGSDHTWITKQSKFDLINKWSVLLNTEYGVPQESVLGFAAIYNIYKWCN